MKRRSFKLISVAGIVLIAMFVLTRAARAASYTFTTLDDPSGAVGTTQAAGINDSRDVVGYYSDSNGAYHGFLYSGGTYTRINDPSAGTARNQGTQPADINDYGSIVGVYTDSSGHKHGFRDIGGTFTRLDYPNATATYAIGINDNGDIVGAYTDSNGAYHGFVYRDYTFSMRDDPSGVDGTYAYDINDGNDIVGVYNDGNDNAHGFLYSGGTYTTLNYLSGGGDTVMGAAGINNNGDIVGVCFDSNGNTYGFLYSGGVFTTIDDPGGVDGTAATGINDNGDIVGTYDDSSGNTHGFLATPSSLWQNATSEGGGWYYLSPFGSFNTNSSPWIYHRTLGWLYPAGTSTDSIWFYDPQWDSHGGWWWTSVSVFPWIYSSSRGEWLYFDAGASTPGARWFCNSTGCAEH